MILNISLKFHTSLKSALIIYCFIGYSVWTLFEAYYPTYQEAVS